MTKEEFLRSLEEIIHAEEFLVPLYLKHMAAIMQWSGCSVENKKRASEIFHSLGEDSQNHKKYFSELKEKIEKGEIDVY